MQFKTLILKTILFILLCSIGCATQQARPYIGNLLDKSGIELNKIKVLSFPQVKEKIISEGLSFTSLKANADITITSPETNGAFRCKGVLRFHKPRKIRVIGSKFVSTVFDMLSDGEDYWFYLPKEKVVYTGKCNTVRKANTNKAELGSRAYIFPDDIAALLDFDKLFEGRRAFMETWPTYWLIHILEDRDEGFVPYSRLKVDRVNNNVTELTIFKDDSFVRVQAFFSDYIKINGQKVPKTVQINWPETDTTLILNLRNLSINEALKSKIFQFKKPKKAEIVKIS